VIIRVWWWFSTGHSHLKVWSWCRVRCRRLQALLGVIELKLIWDKILVSSCRWLGKEKKEIRRFCFCLISVESIPVTPISRYRRLKFILPIVWRLLLYSVLVWKISVLLPRCQSRSRYETITLHLTDYTGKKWIWIQNYSIGMPYLIISRYRYETKSVCWRKWSRQVKLEYSKTMDRIPSYVCWCGLYHKTITYFILPLSPFKSTPTWNHFNLSLSQGFSFGMNSCLPHYTTRIEPSATFYIMGPVT